MTTINNGGKQRDDLLYDFYRRDLWLTRFFSINDSITSAFRLFESALATLDGVTLETVEQIIRDTGKRSQGNLDQLLLFLSQLDVLKSGGATTETPGVSSPDLALEVKQLLNLYTLCCNLRLFVDGAFYTAVHAQWTHEQAPNLPPTALVRECFRRVSIDVEIVQRAMSQRSWETVSDGSYQISQQAEALLVTDKLASMALAPFQHLLPVDDPVLPLTFFSGHTHIHHVPYSDHLLLIGIGYDHIALGANNVGQKMLRGGYQLNSELMALAKQVLPAFELMAIPHEVGHYVYHHARLEGTQSFANLSEKFIGHHFREWCEEIFADVYGCIVAGPLMALSLQALLAASDKHTICANDGEHPTALLRPFILSEILRVLHELHPDKYDFVETTYHLNTNWAAILRHQGNQVLEGDPGDGRCLIQPYDGKAAVNVAEVLQAVRPVIFEFAQHLLSHANFEPWEVSSPDDLSATIPWTQNNYHDLRAYDREMANLSSGDFARRKVPHHTLVAEEQSLGDQLHQFLEGWGDKGPDSGGGSVGTLRATPQLTDKKRSETTSAQQPPKP